MTGWRAATFAALAGAGRALELASRGLVYAAAGVLRRDDLRAATTARWQILGMHERFVDSVLLAWEQEIDRQILRPDDDILVVGCGTGRDLLALLRLGYRAEGLEPAGRAAAIARAAPSLVGCDRALLALLQLHPRSSDARRHARARRAAPLPGRTHARERHPAHRPRAADAARALPYEHHFAPEEFADEVREAGLGLTSHVWDDDGRAVLAARAPA